MGGGGGGGKLFVNNAEICKFKAKDSEKMELCYC